jgi:hypothetical protein
MLFMPTLTIDDENTADLTIESFRRARMSEMSLDGATESEQITFDLIVENRRPVLRMVVSSIGRNEFDSFSEYRLALYEELHLSTRMED